MKKSYTNPELVVIALDVTDIVTASAAAGTTAATTTVTTDVEKDLDLWVPAVTDSWDEE